MTKPTMIIGRAPECDLVLASPQISRQHAQIIRQGEQYFIQDLKSANGTFVNGKGVENQILKDGDEIRFGEFPLSFHTPISQKIKLTDEYLTDAGMTIAVPISQLTPVGVFATKPQARDSKEMVQLIFNAAKTLVGSYDLDKVLSRVMELVFDYLKPDRGFLMLYNEDEGQLVPYVVKESKRRSSKESSINFSRTIVNKVFGEGVSILTANAMSDKRFSTGESIMVQQIRSCMCVPLWDEQKIIGIIYIDSLFYENYFQEHDLDLLSTIAIISAIAIEQSRLNEIITREKSIRERLQRYHSPSVVNRIIEAGEGEVLRTEEREITVLFADLVGFTTISENLEPAEVAHILNTYFSAMTDVIFQNEGTLDKYIGDAVMAVFGVPFAQDDHALRGVKTAVEMSRALEEINRGGLLPKPLQMRIGINSGKVVAGDIGSEKRVDYTVLGSTVNIASRIESSVAKSDEIVIGEATRVLIGERFPITSLGQVSLRGMTAPLTVYRVEKTPIP